MGVNYDRSADFYDDLHGFPPEISERIADTIAAAARAGDQTSFLELGIGTGRVGLPLMLRGYRYFGIDISRRMMERLRAKLPSGRRARLVQASATQLPFADRVFDAVVAIHVLDVVTDWRAVLRESHRVLRPDGIFMQSTRWSTKGSLNWTLRHQLSHFVEEAGGSTDTPGADSPEDAEAELRREGAVMTDVVAAEWVARPVSAAEILEHFAKRMYVNTWSVPDDLLEIVLARLRDWTRTRYGTLDYAEPEQHRFALRIARFPRTRARGDG